MARQALLLRHKIILLTCSMVLIATLIVDAVNYLHTSKIAVNTAIEGLAAETRLTAEKFREGYLQMYTDAYIVSKTPPISGLYRSVENGGIDPFDGSSYERWSNRLQTIFSSIMEARPHYIQMRYIGLADNARELVRVDRKNDELMSVREKDLQSKWGEPYIQQGLLLGPEEAYFSEVTYNREQGKIDSSKTPTVRVVVPVFRNEHLFGFIVINTDFPAMLTKTFETLRTEKRTSVINHAGDYMTLDEDGVLEEFQFHQDYTVPPPDRLLELSHSPNDEQALVADGHASYMVRLQIGVEGESAFLGVVEEVPISRLIEAANKTRIDTLILAFALTILSVMLAGMAAHKMTTPLRRMTQGIVAFGQTKDTGVLDLPTEQKDEIGRLAQSFQTLLNALIESEKRAHAVIDNTVDGIITINHRGTVERYNPACETIFGYLPEEVIGRNINMLMPSPYHEGHDGYLKNYLTTGEKKIIGFRREVEGRRKNGKTFPLELAVSEVGLEEQRLFTGIIRDITLKKLHEKERQALMERLEKSNKELDNFAYIASHDLKEPLRAIHNHSAFLKEDYEDRLEEDGLQRLDRLMELTRRMEKLISDLLYFSRLGNIDKSVKKTDINKIIKDIRTTLHDFLEEKNVTISVPEKLPVVTCDGVRVTELFRNLIVNAVKYCDNPTPHVEIGCTGDSKNSRVFYVKDNGIGIDPEFHDEVFRIFKRLNSRKKYGEGTGAGLSFVKKIVESHNGRIWIESEKGKGSTFFFTLSKDQVK
ncbi:sensor histidine kinase [Emcibacter sp.]|uniref:sensor histidine kinase n=1 Tax=Emcibacter sp. TaxID=1979954 RepID=UPI003A8FD968